MAINKEKKKQILEKIEQLLNEAKSLVFVNFHGLTVSGINEMRRALNGENVSYLVAKKTLIKRALGGKKFSGKAPELLGEVALAWGDDLVAPAREIYGFQKKNPDSLKIIGGIFDGKYMSQTEMFEIASIPPLPVLCGKFVNIINSPIQRFATALGQIAEKKA